jgi:hypothetical protein
MLQAYFDDSTDSKNALIFAGYLSSAERWSRFSSEWSELLNLQPRMDAFKMRLMKGSMERAMFHYRVVERHQLVGIGCAIPIAPLAKVVTEMGLDPDWANPYYLAWRAVITLSLEGSRMIGLNEPIEFVFDEQSEKNTVMKGWEYFYGNAPRKIQKRINGSPRFKSDTEVVPLQAADLLAWWSRKQYLVDKKNMKDLFPNSWTNGKEPTLLFAEMPEQSIRMQFAKDVAVAKNHLWQTELRSSLKKR